MVRVQEEFTTGEQETCNGGRAEGGKTVVVDTYTDKNLGRSSYSVTKHKAMFDTTEPDLKTKNPSFFFSLYTSLGLDRHSLYIPLYL